MILDIILVSQQDDWIIKRVKKSIYQIFLLTIISPLLDTILTMAAPYMIKYIYIYNASFRQSSEKIQYNSVLVIIVAIIKSPKEKLCQEEEL